MTVTTPATIRSIRDYKAGSIGLTLTTPVLTEQERLLFVGLQGTDIELLLKPIASAPGPEVRIEGQPGQKTQSQRIRAVLFVLWQQEPQGMKFEDFYNHRTEQIIQWLKTKLPERAQQTL